MSFKETLTAFIRDNLIEDERDITLDDDVQLIKNGIIDSMAVLQLTNFIEEETGVRVPDREVQLENFQSIANIDAMVTRLKGSAA